MQIRVGTCVLELALGDITEQNVDAIVNAANSELAGGSGVDGAIHDAGGPVLMEQTALRYPNGCPTGSAVATDAGDLNAKYVFHAVGPVWSGGQSGEVDLLQSAYRTCLELAGKHDCESIAFPAISTGVFGYPIDLAAEHSLGCCLDFLQEQQQPKWVRFVLFDSGSYGAYSRVLEDKG